MSYDRKLDQRCQHLVVEEPLFIGQDRQTIRPLRPISSSASVEVRYNGAFNVPPEGVKIAPRILGSSPGPFKIDRNINDIIVLDINQGQFVENIKIPSTNSITSQLLVSNLNKVSKYVRFFEKKNRIGFESIFKGSDATVHPQTDCTFFKTINIPQREYRGKDVLPGWFLVNDPRTLLDRPTRLIVFDEPLPSVQDLFEINYTTLQQECRRCGGIGYENDWRYSKSGEVVQVRDEALLIQESIKITLTELGSNPFHTWYGTNLTLQIGSKVSNSGVTANLIQNDVVQAFNRWQNIKRQQEEKIGQFVSDSEFPYRILSVNVTPAIKDPTIYFVVVKIMNRARNPIQIERGVRVPSDFSGTSLEGVFRESINDFVFSGLNTWQVHHKFILETGRGRQPLS